MKIRRIVIEHFRSIKKLEIFPSGICALVGENNAGKTNILSALHFLLGETWPSKRSLEASDYYQRDTSKPIFIGVEFENNQYGVSKIWCKIPWKDRAETKVAFRTGEIVYLSNDIRDKFGLVYLDANRNLEYHLGHARWTIFGRITRRLDENFRDAFADKRQDLEELFEETLEILRTPLYQSFEDAFVQGFAEQVRRTIYAVSIEFRAFDPLNYYRTLVPLLLEEGIPNNPSLSGQGMRNLILLALFRAYAKVFREDALVAIEEPEIFLHPHAQRSLYSLFREIANEGGQVFYSTHSGNFVDIENFEDVCLVRKVRDEEGDVTTKVFQVPADRLLARRQSLYPSVAMTVAGMKKRYRNISSLEHNEAFFASKIVLVEGETERVALPIYARALGYDFDAQGISVIKAGSKNSLDALYQLFTSFEIPVYLIFDNDRGGADAQLEQNERLLRMLGEPPEREPSGTVQSHYAILEGNFDKEMERALGEKEYRSLKKEAHQELGGKAGKGLIARYMAERLTAEGRVPPFVRDIIREIVQE
ncbi:MAG TPA: AAA family ATPase [Thermoflexia bacterium]|nr:AAA family ATPase [Thermoflexia bacterium]